jgi:hypothetical protein
MELITPSFCAIMFILPLKEKVLSPLREFFIADASLVRIVYRS